MIRLADTGGGTPLYRLKITLRDCKPPIWRRIVVRADMKLDRLHRVIQTAMGWSDCHLHQFAVSGVYYGQPDPEGDDFGPETLNEKRYTVTDLAPGAKQKFTYEYDFGDSWEHEVLVEEVLPPNPDFKHPVCLGGANACPPEDCGGSPGLADPKHEQHEEMKEWVGGAWDATLFSLEHTNAGLKRIKA
jgi:Plasmid pRiA4b ORF-3-like protein